nr:2-acylglycerol O-acyltransferase 3-like [Oryctolagus cuniculus]
MSKSPSLLVKTAELPPSQNYVLGSHPHGAMGTRAFCNFSTKSNAFSRRLPGLQPWVLSQPQWGQAVVIVMGGAQEALYTAPGQHSLDFLNCKVFLCRALRLRASLVPVYSFGEKDIFRCKAFSKGSWRYLCQVTCKRVTSIAPRIFWGRGLFSPNSQGLLLPFSSVLGVQGHAACST